MFTGRRWDEILALYDYRTRYYNPYLGRFLRIDTIGLWGDASNLGNPYAYVGNNPWSYSDPYGLAPEWLERTGRVAATGVVVGANVAAWVLLTPIGGAIVTSTTVGLGGTTAYYNRQAQAIETTGQPLPAISAVGVAANDVVGFSAVYTITTGRDALTDATVSPADRIEMGAHVTVGLAGGVAGGKGAIAARPFVERGPVLWGQTGSQPVGGAVAPKGTGLARRGEQLEFDFVKSISSTSPNRVPNLAIRPGGRFYVGEYSALRKITSPGLDAHHVGQAAAYERFIPGYDRGTGPAILVPKEGHTLPSPLGIVSRRAEGFSNAREVLARDIMELRRVYPAVPNSQLQRLIDLNKTKYPILRRRP
jgi:RHS repeat-associated protein